MNKQERKIIQKIVDTAFEDYKTGDPVLKSSGLLIAIADLKSLLDRK